MASDTPGTRVVKEAQAVYSAAEVKPPKSKKAKGNADSESTPYVRLLGLATWVLGTPEIAERFLNAKHGMLDHKTPKEISKTEEGEQAVTRLLMSIAYGFSI